MNAVTPYRPQARTLAARVMAFFAANPEEELSMTDIELKFDVPSNDVPQQLKRAVTTGALVRRRSVYAAGPALQVAEPDTPPQAAVTESGSAPEPAPEPSPALSKSDFRRLVAGLPAAPAPRKSSASHQIDVDALVIEKGVPYLLRSNAAGVSKWDAVFDKLAEPGDSTAVPASIKSALAAAVRQRNKRQRGEFRTAITSATTARLWRIA